MRLAGVSDIHGNLPALEAVLADIERRGISRIVNLGDSLYGPIDPAHTADLLIRLKWPTVRGNEDRILLFPPSDTSDSPSLEYTVQSLSGDHVIWLASLAMTAEAFDFCYMFHGSPERDDRYFLSEVTPHGIAARSVETLEDETAGIYQPIILCGHDHTPRICHLPDNRLIVNPGSVGLQAYTDHSPYPHVIQTGSPHARYAIIENTGGNWSAEIIPVEYDWNRAADLAAAHGRPDWAIWLKTGIAGVA
ncbi:YfcE family phosphodiesterase [candidate division GN15 bacterium]|uniref:YfcE family phosphodiesterase n=1 Tax=candidate division GN15 bacterium TaxID=2072418 RepID=A0A855X059_9BACT|nr:MAG: YfcE family phosphodiesterase [candidate division GN15 bacterium]